MAAFRAFWLTAELLVSAQAALEQGGIKTLAQAEELLAAGATRLGLTATAKIAEEALKNA